MQNCVVYILIISAGLISCAPQPKFSSSGIEMGDYYYRASTTYAQKKADLQSCVASAANTISENRISYIKPVEQAPITCSKYGRTLHCSGGEITGGYRTSLDSNVSTRIDHVQRCLERKGYSKSSIVVDRCDYDFRLKGKKRNESPIESKEDIVCAWSYKIPYDKQRFNEGFKFIHGYSEKYLLEATN